MNRVKIKVKLDELGRVTVPKIFRDALGMELGREITCSINEQGHIEYYFEEEKGEQNHD